MNVMFSAMAIAVRIIIARSEELSRRQNDVDNIETRFGDSPWSFRMMVAACFVYSLVREPDLPRDTVHEIG